MDGYPLVYRCAVLMIPQQPFLEWLNEIEPEEKMTLRELQEDCNIYLVPGYENEIDMEKAVNKYLKLNYVGIFTNELSNWYLDPEPYPKLSYETFLDWFKTSTHTMIFDTVNQPILKE